MSAAVRYLILAAALLLGASAKAQTTLSVSPTTVAAGGSVTATWSGVASPLWSDWIGLFTPSAQDWSYTAWSYTGGTASGSIPFTIPSNTAPGTYQLRLFSGGVKRATSNNFTALRAVTGTVTLGGSPLAGVAFTASNGGVCTTSNASGIYFCAVANGWSGTVTPTPTSYTFTPTSRSYSNVTTNQTAQNYTAVPYRQISGAVTFNGLPLANVAFSTGGTGSCTASDASGQYSCAVPDGWTGSVTPSQTGYAFTPSSKSYTAISADDLGEDYTATLTTPVAAIAFVHVDHLNTPRLVANGASQTVWRWDQQEPFGVDAADENPSSLGVYEFPLRYSGQYADKETNLHYNYFRDYDSGIGRYPQSDAIGLRGGLNTYAYVASNPLSSTDPDGLFVRPGPRITELLRPESPAAPKPGPGTLDPIYPIPLPEPGPRGQGSEKCFLYFIMDCNQAVVYVGITNNPKRRESEHRYRGVIKSRQCLGCRLDFITVREYSSRQMCVADEIFEIQGRRPIFNTLHNPDPLQEIQRKRNEWIEKNCCR